MAKKVLITGAAGLIGRELCKQLSTYGYDVTGIDDNRRFSDVIPSDCTFICSDLSKYYNRSENIYDIIFHLAAINGTEYFYNDPNKTLENNVRIDLDTFNFVKTNSKCKLIYSSSSEVVAGSHLIPTSEISDVIIEDIHNARWSYRLPKILAENYLVNSDINYLIVRFYNVFGMNSGRGHFFKDILDKIKKNEYLLIGSDETRSFCWVEDAVDALIYLSLNSKNEIINIGNDEEISIIDAANIIADEIFKQKIQWTTLPGRKGSVNRRAPCIKKLKELYPTYHPRSFRESVQTIKQMLENFNENKEI